jgi:nitroreductase
MNIKELVSKTRSYRRFDESHKIEKKTLIELVDLARMSASGANMQPLKYLLYNTPETCDKILPTLAWAGYLANWSAPEKGERPTAYIIILGDRNVAETINADHGIAAQSIMLGATSEGIGGCIISSIRKEELRKSLKISDRYEIMFVVALGKPIETVIVDEMQGNSIRYWRDADNTHHVPKRSLKDVILNL